MMGATPQTLFNARLDPTPILGAATVQDQDRKNAYTFPLLTGTYSVGGSRQIPCRGTHTISLVKQVTGAFHSRTRNIDRHLPAW